jgi:cytochrome b
MSGAKTYVWSLPTRVFHLLLIFFVTGAYLSSEEESFLILHSAFGYGVAILVIFRFIWGFIAPQYSKFKDFPLNIKEAKDFFNSHILNRGEKRLYIGHNPLASYVMVAILITLFLVVLTGALTFGVQEGRGVFSYLNNSLFKEMELFEEIHEFFTSILMLLISIHIIGVVTDYILNRGVGTLSSIFTEYKTLKGVDVKLSTSQKVISTIFLTLAVVVFLWALQENSILNSSINREVNYKKHSKVFVKECGSCHTLYPPHLLPKSSWVTLMKKEALIDHFGDDASVDERNRVEILNFLKENSANSSKKEASVYILSSLREKDRVVSITKTPYWIDRHKKISKDIFNSKRIKSKSNCKACHSDIEKGLIEDMNIKIPKV